MKTPKAGLCSRRTELRAVPITVNSCSGGAATLQSAEEAECLLPSQASCFW